MDQEDVSRDPYLRNIQILADSIMDPKCPGMNITPDGVITFTLPSEARDALRVVYGPMLDPPDADK